MKMKSDFSNYYFDEEINMIGTVSSTKGSIRGNLLSSNSDPKCLLTTKAI